LKFFGESAHGHVAAEGMAPTCEQAFFILQIQAAYAGVVVMFQDLTGMQIPVFPIRFAGCLGEDALVGQNHDAMVEAELQIQIELKAGHHRFPSG
jgi:hypothetical protein